jgi:S1-C subfamily serine protease
MNNNYWRRIMKKLNLTAILAAGALALSPALVSAQPAQPWMMGYGLKAHPEGAQIGIVAPGGTAAAMGLKAGDIIMELNGKPISQQLVEEHSQKTKLGDEVKLKVKRAGMVTELTGKAIPQPPHP